jgi:hypothetical protein
VNAASVCGAVSIYLLIGMLFVFLYAAVRRSAATSSSRREWRGHDPCSSTSATSRCSRSATATTPANQVGKTFAVMEALFGQLYLVTVVAVLVSSFGRRRGPG